MESFAPLMSNGLRHRSCAQASTKKSLLRSLEIFKKHSKRTKTTTIPTLLKCSKSSDKLTLKSFHRYHDHTTNDNESGTNDILTT